MTQKLDLKTLKRLNKELEETKPISAIGFEVKINTVFKESKVDKVIFDYFCLFEDASRNGDIDEDFIRGMGGILHTLILREFSDVPSIPTQRDLKKVIQIATVLYDTGIMEAVMAEFDELELKKVYNKLEKNSKRVGAILGEFALSSTLSEGAEKSDNSQELEGTGEGAPSDTIKDK
ncbi:hypothetical protein [Paenibacillus sp. ISL-20]|uniref:hypothetical protein n=1 Tax=Paenibacillus sp. ISL-20 TaxID=2819163 RepID=UPI001BE71810|nr:hypothetical protein [Paenibacillus sp. ISL-20]MBT2759845.1 hypothetical protein [Paenibacillus sp. ISL-20]